MSAAETAIVTPGATTLNQLTMQGRIRTYLLRVPAVAGSTSIPRPVVFCLHGGGGTASGQETLSGFSTKAEQVGCIVVYPEGVADPSSGKRNFADGRGLNYAEQQGVDDVAFIAGLLDAVSAATPVDRLRVYSCGISNGGLMSQRLGEQLSDRIAAIAPIAANIPQPLAANFLSQVPVAVLQMSGTADAFMPYAGGEVLQNGVAQVPTLGYVTSATQAVALWVANNHASIAPVLASGYVTTHAAVPDDGCTVDRYTYAGPSGGDVVLMSINGGGHTWPSGQNPGFLGNECRDVAGTDEIWSFFSSHAKQSPALALAASATTTSGSAQVALSVAAVDAGALTFTWNLSGPGTAILTGNGSTGAHDLTATCPVSGLWNATVTIRNALGLEITSQTAFTIAPGANQAPSISTPAQAQAEVLALP
jgi:polyhydroxybutyrate depolymerase